MGWKFLESIGEKVAAAAKGDNDEMAKALIAKVNEAKLDIDDLEIEFADGVATISGLAADEAAVEKAVLIVGNTEGVSEVEADGFVAGITDAEKAEYAKARTEAMNRARAAAAARAEAKAEARDDAAAETAAKAEEEAALKARRVLRKRRRKAQAAAEKLSSKFYTVESGDTLSKIAQEQYGDGSKYPIIFEANTPMLKSADLIYPGQVLRIPPLDA